MLSGFSRAGEWRDAESPYYGEYERDEYGAGVRRNEYVNCNININLNAPAADGDLNGDKPAADSNVAAAHRDDATTDRDGDYEAIGRDDFTDGDQYAQAANGNAAAANGDLHA